jgi:hypothetical protein
MAVLESRDYQAARERLKGNPVIAMMAASVVTVPLAGLAHEDGTPRSHLMSQANRGFDDAEARNAGNPAYQPYPPGAPRHRPGVCFPVKSMCRSPGHYFSRT